MKRFNIAVMSLWLFVFFCSLRETSWIEATEGNGIGWVMSNVVCKVNSFAWSNCPACTTPRTPISVKMEETYAQQTPTGTMKEVTSTFYVLKNDYDNLSDSRMTRTILENTMIPLIMFMLALNIAFYAGKGTINRMSVQTISTLQRSWSKLQHGISLPHNIKPPNLEKEMET